MFQRILSALLFGLLLVAQFADCAIAPLPSKQDMQCCGAMPCSTANRSEDCCAKMTSSQLPSALPSSRIALSVPVVSAVPWRSPTDAAQYTPSISYAVQVQEHSPPDLYILDHALLI